MAKHVFFAILYFTKLTGYQPSPLKKQLKAARIPTWNEFRETQMDEWTDRKTKVTYIPISFTLQAEEANDATKTYN
jgi:hypothetical protein